MSARSLNWLKFGGLVGLAFALGLLFAGLLDLPSRGQAQELATRQAIAQVKPPELPASVRGLQDLSDAFAAVVDAVRPSVVYVKSSRTEKAADRRQQQMVPPGMDQFLPRFRQRPEFQQGSGSGFIVSADGYILTNNHVVADAENVTVRLLDRREFKAKVVGADPNTDVAVLKIDATGLKPVALGNSDNERIGEWVMAIGNPLGEDLTFSVTSGIISARGRSLRGLIRSNYDISDFIQTDAAINPGNSGGPLLNVRGEVIGINSAIASETGFYSGYGFAVPVNLARTVMNQLITDGKVHRAALGIAIDEASTKDAKYVGLDEVRGILVRDITGADSPAGKAGMVAGDVIIAVDGQRVDRVGQLQQLVGFRKAGEVVEVEVARKGGERKKFKVRLQALDATTNVATADAKGNDDSASDKAGATTAALGRLGISVQPLTAETVQEMGLPATTRGLLVTDVVPGGPAYEVLAEPSQYGADIILAVEGKPVRTEVEFRAALKGFKAGDVITLQVGRPTQSGMVKRVERIQLGDTN